MDVNRVKSRESSLKKFVQGHTLTQGYFDVCREGNEME